MVYLRSGLGTSPGSRSAVALGDVVSGMCARPPSCLALPGSIEAARQALKPLPRPGLLDEHGAQTSRLYRAVEEDLFGRGDGRNPVRTEAQGLLAGRAQGREPSLPGDLAKHGVIADVQDLDEEGAVGCVPKRPALSVPHRAAVEGEGQRRAGLVAGDVDLDPVPACEPINLPAPVAPYVLPARLGQGRRSRPQLERQPLDLYPVLVLGFLDLETHDVAVGTYHVEKVPQGHSIHPEVCSADPRSCTTSPRQIPANLRS